MEGLANLDCCPGFGSRLRAPGARPSPISSHRIAPPPASQPAGQLAHHHQATLDASRQVRGARYYLRRFYPQSVVSRRRRRHFRRFASTTSLSPSFFAHTCMHTYTYNTLVILRRRPPSVAQQPPLSFTHTCATTTTTSPNNTFVPPNKTTAQSPARRS